MPLLDHAAFCNACGTAVRVQPKPHRPPAGAVGAVGWRRAAVRAESTVPDLDSPGRRGVTPQPGRRSHRPPTRSTARRDRRQPGPDADAETGSTTTRRAGRDAESSRLGSAGPGLSQDPRGNSRLSRVADTASKAVAQPGGYPPQQPGLRRSAARPYPPQGGGYPPQQGGYPQQGSYDPQGVRRDRSRGSRRAATRTRAKAATSRPQPAGGWPGWSRRRTRVRQPRRARR